MENILRQLVKEKATGSYVTARTGSNSDKCIVESICNDCGCTLTDWFEHDFGSIVMDFQANHGHFIIVAQA